MSLRVEKDDEWEFRRGMHELEGCLVESSLRNCAIVRVDKAEWVNIVKRVVCDREVAPLWEGLPAEYASVHLLTFDREGVKKQLIPVVSNFDDDSVLNRQHMLHIEDHGHNEL